MMEERLRAVEVEQARQDERYQALTDIVAAIKDDQDDFFKETREHRARRNGNHWKEKGGIALGGGGLGAGTLAGLQALIERLAS